MLLPNDQPFDPDSWLEVRKRAVLEFSAKIDRCIDGLEWDNLTAVLKSRQQYLEQLSQEPIPEVFKASIKHLVQSILQQDEIFQARIQRQKNIATQQQVAIERGRRAIDAYNSQ